VIGIAHPASMGHGIDGLQDVTNICAFFGHWWNLEEYLQFIERIGPVRQKQSGHNRPVYVYPILAKDTVDEDVMYRRESKREVQDVLARSDEKEKQMTERQGSWMQTATGRAYWPVDPRGEDVCIEDIAHALGHLCRYGGPHHDVLQRRGATRPRPTCRCAAASQESLPGTPRSRSCNWRAICDHFGLTYEMPKCIHDADVAILYAEREALLLPSPRDDWGMGLVTPMKANPGSIFGYMPGRASALYMARFDELKELKEEALV
jgi:hypothetical protein